MIGGILMIVAFVGLVVIHERGHMTAAKKVGVDVEEFGIGIPPRIGTIGHDHHGTHYTLNLIPLGGFVRLTGDNPHDPKSFTSTGSYLQTSRIRKIIILIAGIVMNILTARVIFTILFVIGTKPLTIVPDTINSHSYLMPSISTANDRGIISMDDTSPALIAAIQPASRATIQQIQTGSIITQINNSTITATTLKDTLHKQCKNNTCTITRQAPVKTTDQTAEYQCVDTCLLGVMIDTSDAITIHHIQYPRRQAPIIAAQEIQHQTQMTFSSLGSLISTLRSGNKAQKQEATAQLSGPVGIVGIGQTIAQQGARSQRRILVGMISLALGLFNLLPIPALDGGRILGVLIQTIGRIPASSYYRIEGMINSIIMLILLLLGIIIMAKDAAQFYCWDNTLTQTIFGDSVQCVEK